MREEPFLLSIPKGFLSAVLHRARSRRIVILAHGHTGQKIETNRLFVHAARALADAGINALRFDFFGSGDSSGEFCEMSPNTEIDDLKRVVTWAGKQGFRSVGLLGLSFGGAVTICTAHQLKPGVLKSIVTWSSVPSFRTWRAEPDEPFAKPSSNPNGHGRCFYRDRPEVDVPEAFLALTVPKLQIQGDNDLPGFREAFAAYFAKASGPKKHRVIAGANHTFDQPVHRRRAIRETVRWFQQTLG